jgi:hypothetical protein
MNVNEVIAYLVSAELKAEEINRIIEAVRFARGKVGQQNRKEFKINDNVKFKGRSGQYEYGKIVKINRKRFVVEVNWRQWNVPMNMIEAA